MNPASSKTIVLAGVAGGVAEIAWVLAYGAFAPVDAAEVARAVAATVVPDATSAALGVAIHLALSIVLAAAIAAALGRFVRGPGAIPIGVAALMAVWAVNFLLVLPLVNPGFVTLMPYAATLASKALFGAAMAAVLSSSPRDGLLNLSLPKKSNGAAKRIAVS